MAFICTEDAIIVPLISLRTVVISERNSTVTTGTILGSEIEKGGRKLT